MKHLLDEDLVKQTLAGDQQAFEILVKRYEKQIFSLAYRLCSDYDEATDLAQEAFLQIYKVLDRYDNQKKFFSWMYRVAHNTCINALNRRPKNTMAVEDVSIYMGETTDTSSQPETYYTNKELRQQIDQAILNLPDNYRDIIYLRYIQELSYQQIADTMQLPLSTIETRLYRGRQLLQKSLNSFLERRR